MVKLLLGVGIGVALTLAQLRGWFIWTWGPCGDGW